MKKDIWKSVLAYTLFFVLVGTVFLKMVHEVNLQNERISKQTDYVVFEQTEEKICYLKNNEDEDGLIPTVVKIFNNSIQTVVENTKKIIRISLDFLF